MSRLFICFCFTSHPCLYIWLTSLINRERSQVNLQLLSDLCDLTIPVSALGWLRLDDGLVGLAGSLSNGIGVYNQWKKTA